MGCECAGCCGAVLGVSFVVEGYSLLVATRAVLQGAQAMGITFWEYLRRGMDPTTVAVMMEDGAAVTGLLIAGAPPPAALRRAAGCAALWPDWAAALQPGCCSQAAHHMASVMALLCGDCSVLASTLGLCCSPESLAHAAFSAPAMDRLYMCSPWLAWAWQACFGLCACQWEASYIAVGRCAMHAGAAAHVACRLCGVPPLLCSQHAARMLSCLQAPRHAWCT